MKHTFLALAGAAALVAAPASAIDLGGLLGGGNDKAQAPVVDLNSGIDAVAGQGTSAVLNGDVNPLVALAAKQLGVPDQYMPQLQALYKQFAGGTEVTAQSVNEQAGLSSWLGNKPGLNAETFATALNGFFGRAN